MKRIVYIIILLLLLLLLFNTKKIVFDGELTFGSILLFSISKNISTINNY